MDPTPASELKSDLESFRQEWLSEVRSRKPEARPRTGPSSSAPGAPGASGSGTSPSHTGPAATVAALRLDGPSSQPPTSSRPALSHIDDDYVRPPTFDERLDVSASAKEKGKKGQEQRVQELSTALDHFEAAVAKESEGILGESLSLYRKAFRMDGLVDLLYRKKHFPTGPSRPPTQSASSVLPPTAEKPAESLQSVSDLISEFAGLSIVPTAPEVENTPAPPCPIARLPGELLVHILRDVALDDVGDFNRLSQVCKRFAYLVATEQSIWRRVCLGAEFGFGGMHYRFQLTISWDPLPIDRPIDELINEAWHPVTAEELVEREWAEKQVITKALLPKLYASDWRHMFRTRPRVRFNGCYISTVNYIRAGQANSNAVTWDDPVHIVTYYRYLRFFRDGTVISLLTTEVPTNVVHYLTKDLISLHKNGGAPHLPSSVMASALKGRWRLSSAEDKPDATLNEIEGDLYVETEGVGYKYIYRMELSLRSAGKGGARNNKLGWRGFYSYNRLTDDWAEFRLKNDRPFFFSRVKSYGVGQ